jgi:uncharacterized protein YbaP (TraB family)
MNKLIIALTFIFGYHGLNAQIEFPMEKSSLLWKIKGPGVENGCYLFGTMHLIEKEYFIFPKKLEKMVSKSDVLVMELKGLPNQLEAQNYLMLEEGTFFDYFTEEQKDSILDWAKAELNMSPTAFEKSFSGMKPFVVVQVATQLHFMGKTESYEMSFNDIALANNIPMEGLETIADQMKIFDDLSKDQQAEMVMEGARNPDEGVEMTERMMKLYTTQNVDSLFLMIQDEGGVLADEQSSFLDQRNENWIPKIEEIITTKSAFIAVGAGHLGGPNGVIRLLEKKGYTLTPVKL